MAGKPTIKNTIIREYLKKFPDCSYASLARKIYKENSTTFKDVESIRSQVRYIVGSTGVNHKA